MPVSSARSEPLDVLIVEDEPDAREVLSEFCAAQGFRVASAQDGRAAIDALRRATPPFPIVITDLHMPHADGFEVLDAARLANASCYVIIITGYATIDGAVRAVRSGAYDFLAKPFALGQVELILARVRDRMMLETENRSLVRQIEDDKPGRAVSPAFSDRLRLVEDRVAALERIVMRQQVR